MTQSTSAAPQQIIELVERFDAQRESYQSPSYNETQLRREFIDPFFKALGWDIDNEQGYAEAYKDVVHEDAVKIGGTTKAPDYCFRIGGQRKFFVEAKKPSVNIAQDVSPAFQLRRYAWTAKLPLSILTDFEEFAVYDCRLHKPVKTDKASKARTFYFKFTDYVDRWEEIASIFSPEAIRKGSFDKYAAAHKKRRGTAEVDDEFLKEIENWRTLLARNLALRNPQLSQRELNFAVQRTIDRIIFLRICEDRGVERSTQLQGLLNGAKIYPRLCELFEQADDRYNSGLFHFHQEKGRPEEPDTFTLSLKIDDKPLKEIIGHLYYPDSPYEFSVFPADILGQVYEQFLGKVIRLTKGHQAKIEEKPEVKKAGGVYYTPTYIVDYIVEQTVGKLLEGKTPQQIGGLTKTWKPSKRRRPFSVLDPACGSGSFLIGAYQKLLDWHRDWYVNDGPANHKDRIYQAKGEEWRLTTAERKRILLSHIYGVDIDPQAVEVTKLSLLLKVLEGENRETLQRQLKMFKERALPDLTSNIKCGNSLIGPDFYDYGGQQKSLFDDDEMLRINAFDWSEEFPIIIGDGGFDAIIGNPPYLNAIEEATRFDKARADYTRINFESARGAFDVSILFQELGIRLIRPNGLTSLIVPNKFLSAVFGRAFREFAARECHLETLADYSRADVFPGVGVYPFVYVASKDSCRDTPSTIQLERYIAGPEKPILESESRVSAKLESLDTWDQLYSESQDLLARLASLPRLGSQYEVAASATVDEAYRIKSSILDSGEAGECFRFVTSGAIDRYRHFHGIKSIRYLKSTFDQPHLPTTCVELSSNRLRQYSSEKLIVAGMTKRLEVVWDDGRLAGAVPTVQILATADSSFSLKCMLGIMNSRLIDWTFRQYFSSLSLAGGYLRIGVPQIREMPIPTQNGNVEESAALLDVLGKLVDSMVQLNAQLDTALTTNEKSVIRRHIADLDKRIDRLVYDLFEIAEDDILAIESDLEY